ncbi:MAG: tRNA 2-thiouridine(34) synthase MnmA [Candidatus Pacebacteria bacterium]|nr:tRNA 2-thiouridine(34) synthase MnmA [Candidatus Paceibacterota bacterium]
MAENKRKKKVYVGLSGGVDSSVSAALLKKAGYDVTGVFIKVWQADFLPCNWKEERLDAMRICARLGIPFLTFDLQKEYKREVVDYMIREYKAGRTPNPDVMCNRHVKFRAFFDKARKMGADYVATGHYAQVAKTKSGKFEMKAGTDANKDQSYFLWTLTQKELSKTFFPVGNIEKPEVRKLAEKFNLHTATKKDSQGLCFIGKVDLKVFLSHFVKEKPGKVLDESGKTIGKHEGAFFYTLGQRHGFTITKKTPHDTPYYIVKKDIKKNILIVSEKKPENNFLKDTRIVKIEDTNWISEIPQKGKLFCARVRYRQPLEKCTIQIKSKKTAIVTFEKPIQAVTSGQSLVVYDKDVCLGGGVIS